MAASVRHSVSVQGADDPSKSVNAAEWNADHTLVDVAAQTDLDALSAQVSVLSVLVSSLTGGGEVHPTSDEFSVLTDRVGVISGLTSANTVQTNAVSGAVSTLSLAVSVVAANLSTLSLQTSVNTAQINAVSGAISTLSLAVSVVEANRNALSQQLSTTSVALSAEIALRATLSTQVTNVSGAISTLSLAVSVVEASRNALSQQVSTTSVALSAEIALRATLSTQVTNVSGAISTLSLAVSTVAANLSALSVLHSALSVQVTNVSGAISTLSLAVSTVAATLSALSAQHSTLSVQVSVLSAQMTSIAANKVVVQNAQTISVSALTNVSGMSFSVGANNTYAFKYMIIYQMASTTSGLGLSVTFPGMKTFAAQAEIPSAANGVSQLFCGAIATTGTKIQALSCQTAATDFYAKVEGVFTVSTTGTLQLQANAGIGGTSAQLIIRQGTFGMIWRGA